MKCFARLTLFVAFVLPGLCVPAAETSNPVVVKYAGGSISLDDLRLVRSQARPRAADEPRGDELKSFVDELILNRLLGLEARELGMDRDVKIQAKLDKLLTIAYLRARIPKDKLLVNRAEIEAYYAAHQEEYRKPRRVRIAHILVNNAKHAEQISEALAQGIEFGDLARDRSLDSTSSALGGDLGWKDVGELPEGLAEVAGRLRPGEVSEPVKTRFGHHVVKVESIAPIEYSRLDNTLAQEIHAVLQDAKYRELFDQLKRQAWLTHRVNTDQAALAALTTDTPPSTVILPDNSVPDRPEDELVLATIGEETITVADLRQLHPDLLSFVGQGLSAEQLGSTLDHHLTGLIFAREARRQRMDEEARIQVKLDSVLGAAYLNSRYPTASFKIRPQEIEAFYEAHKEEFEVPRRVQVAHILLKSEAEGRAVVADLTAGADFGDLARARSIDPASGPRGGDLGLQPAWQLHATLANEALRLTPGEVSGPVESPFGFHIVKLIAVSPIEHRPFGSVRGMLRDRLVRSKREALAADLQKQLWQKYQVAVDLNVLGSMAAADVPPSTGVKTHDALPRVQFLSRVYFGEAEGTKRTKHRILVANVGDADLTLENLRGNCRCFLPAEHGVTRLGRGEVTELVFSIDPDQVAKNGRRDFAIAVDTNDPTSPRASIRVHMNTPKQEHQG